MKGADELYRIEVGAEEVDTVSVSREICIIGHSYGNWSMRRGCRNRCSTGTRDALRVRNPSQAWV